MVVVYMYSGQRRSAGSAQVSGEQVPEMDGSMALMATEEGAGTGEVVALAGVYTRIYHLFCLLHGTEGITRTIIRNYFLYHCSNHYSTLIIIHLNHYFIYSENQCVHASAVHRRRNG